MRFMATSTSSAHATPEWQTRKLYVPPYCMTNSASSIDVAERATWSKACQEMPRLRTSDTGTFPKWNTRVLPACTVPEPGGPTGCRNRALRAVSTRRSFIDGGSQIPVSPVVPNSNSLSAVRTGCDCGQALCCPRRCGQAPACPQRRQSPPSAWKSGPVTVAGFRGPPPRKRRRPRDG